MNIHKTKIDWATHTWNPVTGCLHNCEYCYARRITSRFQPHICERPMSTGTLSSEGGATGIINEEGAEGCYVVCRPVKLADETGEYTRSTPYPKGFAPTLHAYTMDYPKKRFIPSRIFVSSMGDLFGEWVPDSWIESVFAACKEAPQHTYMFLTKNPGRYTKLAAAGKLPTEDNFWYGSTVTRPDTPFWYSDRHNTFVSIEPLLAPFDGIESEAAYKVGWVIVGAMTGPGSRKHQPQREWVEAIVAGAHAAGRPVFMKSSLTDIWVAPLLLEHPTGIVWPEDAEK